MGNERNGKSDNEQKSKKGGSGMVIARRGIELVIDTIGEILAFLAVILILIMCINGVLPTPFITGKALEVMSYVREISILSIVGLKGMEFALKKSWILTVIFGLILAAIIVLMFFPESIPTWLSAISAG
jgi:nitrate reductase gamma subunit